MRFLRQAFADLPIAKKLYIGFGAVIALLLAYAIEIIRDFNILGKEFRAYSEMANESRLVRDVKEELVNLQLQIREYLVTQSYGDADHAGEAYQSLIWTLTRAKEIIQRPGPGRVIDNKQIARLDEILKLTGEYGEGFDRVVELNKKRDLMVYQVLNPTGRKLRETLTDIAKSAYEEQSYLSARYAGLVQERLLTAQIYVVRFISSNNLFDIQRAVDGFNEVEDALLSFEASFPSPEHRRMLDAIKSDISIYRDTFDQLVGTIAERNRIRSEVFDKTGAEIVKRAKAFEEETYAKMKALDTNVAEEVLKQRAEIFVASVLALSAAMVIAWIIGRGIGGPIRTMTRAMERLASGDTSVVIPSAGHADEVGSMAATVQVFKESMTETERLREAERLALQAAETANRAKTEFLSNMSHELRTPLNAVMGFAQILEMDRTLSPKQKESVRTIYKAAGHLLALINEVLDLARVESGKLTLSIETVSLADQFGECATLMGAIAGEKGIRLEFAPIEDHLCVRADRVRLKQTLVNLISNAVKYNRVQGSVRVSAAESDDDKVRIAVTDTGLGIPAQQMSKLFTPFERLGADTTGVEGAGIGLSLTKRLIEAMEGTIGVESTVGASSTFWFVLPMATRAADHVAVKMTPDRAINNNAAEAGAANTGVARVVYVDDNQLNLKLVRQILGVLPQIELLDADRARQGLDLIFKHAPDLILLDINMPEMNGLEMLARIRAEPETRATRVIAVSAAAMSRDIARAMDAGFDDYVTKPIDIPNFLEKVSLCLQKIRSNKARGGG